MRFRGGVDAVRSPRAADGGVTERIVSGVMRYGDDELAFRFGKSLKDLFLNKLDIDNREGASGLFRGEDITVAYGNSDLDGFDLRFAE